MDRSHHPWQRRQQQRQRQRRQWRVQPAPRLRAVPHCVAAGARLGGPVGLRLGQQLWQRLLERALLPSVWLLTSCQLAVLEPSAAMPDSCGGGAVAPAAS